MANRESVKTRVIQVIDVISPLDLSKKKPDEIEGVKINFTSGFDSALKRALCVPLSKIARAHGGNQSRVISQTETATLKTIKGAIDLTVAAADGEPFEGE